MSNVITHFFYLALFMFREYIYHRHAVGRAPIKEFLALVMFRNRIPKNTRTSFDTSRVSIPFSLPTGCKLGHSTLNSTLVVSHVSSQHSAKIGCTSSVNTQISSFVVNRVSCPFL